MLKHRINIKDVVDERNQLTIEKMELFEFENENSIIVTCHYNDESNLENINKIYCVNSVLVDNNLTTDEFTIKDDSQVSEYFFENYYDIDDSLNEVDRTFSFEIPYYIELSVDKIYKNKENDIEYLYVYFQTPHYFSAIAPTTSFENNIVEQFDSTNKLLFDLLVQDYGKNELLNITHDDRYYVEVVYDNCIRIKANENVTVGISDIEDILKTTDIDASFVSNIKMYRKNILFSDFCTKKIYYDLIKTRLQIPFTSSKQINLQKENILNEYIEDAKQRAINNITDMEKDIYYPVIVNELYIKQNDGSFTVNEKGKYKFIKADEEYEGRKYIKQDDGTFIGEYVGQKYIKREDGTFIEADKDYKGQRYIKQEDGTFIEFKEGEYMIKKAGYYDDVHTIKFNFHFRERDNENWTTENDKYWNGANIIKYVKDAEGEYKSTNVGNEYKGQRYTKQNDGSFTVDEKGMYAIEKITDEYTGVRYSKKSVLGLNSNFFSYKDASRQSDLLYLLDFANGDVRYQKNKLKKSFVRLSFYDSPKLGSQNLLSYSTIFLDSGDLFTKFVRHMTDKPYKQLIDNEYIKDELEGIKVNREPSEKLIENKKDEDIEDYRLSSQVIVTNKYNSDQSSEGFYLYLWRDLLPFLQDKGKKGTLDVYLKVEFNHAGYGRVVPFMMPYWDKNKWNGEDGYLKKEGIKTFQEIIDDWLVVGNDPDKDDNSNVGNSSDVKDDSVVDDDTDADNDTEGDNVPDDDDDTEGGDDSNVNDDSDVNNEPEGNNGSETYKHYFDGQYGAKQYIKFSYIHFKIGYDENMGRYIYYLDNGIYGGGDINGEENNVITLNLYEVMMV